MTKRLPYALQKRGALLLHQQCWLWGQDICRKEGNLLVQQGFQRTPPPDGVTGSTQYCLALEGPWHVRLWGFGIYYGEDHGTFLNRYAFQPLCASVSADVWTPESFQGCPVSQDLGAMVRLVQWIADFEEAVQQEFGIAYRSRCMSGFKRKAISPRNFVQAWKELAQQLANFEAISVATPENSNRLGCEVPGRVTGTQVAL